MVECWSTAEGSTAEALPETGAPVVQQEGSRIAFTGLLGA